MKLTGRAWKYGDNINTDLLFPGKFTYTLRERDEIAQHALEDLDAEFVRQVQPGDMLVGGRNFGCGSSREQAATALVYNGVSAVIAVSFGRIFYRNALNNGLLAVVCPEAVQAIEQGDQITIELNQCSILCNGRRFVFPRLSPTILGIVEAGGLVAHTQRKLASR